MDGLLEFKTEDGALVVVEDAGARPGARLVSRGDGPAQAARTFEGALEGVRGAAAAALRVFRDGPLCPDAVEIEFGVRLSAEAGAVIAKGSTEGHLVVKLSWSPGQPSPQTVPGRTVPGQSVPGQSAPEQAVPGQSVPGQAVTGQAVPGQSAPEQAVPGQAVPGQSAPEQAVPGQAVPEQSAPHGGPGRTAPGPEFPDR
ncbi:CU044_2847 family protein [Streptomyces sp. NPDC048514]|uniref:CU044_2847 family protein n=1 Tax=Streptomyces sp. NPDC048514 TaxID=3365564 RepID=UPI00371B0996